MDTQYFQRFVEMTKNFQKPLQELSDLNIKTLQSMTYLRPDEMAKIRVPEEFFEKQVNLTIENSHKALDYMKKSFEILENSMAGLSKSSSLLSSKDRLEKMFNLNSAMMQPGFTKAMTETMLSPKKKASTKAKKTTTGVKKSASTAAKKKVAASASKAKSANTIAASASTKKKASTAKKKAGTSLLKRKASTAVKKASASASAKKKTTTAKRKASTAVKKAASSSMKRKVSSTAKKKTAAKKGSMQMSALKKGMKALPTQTKAKKASKASKAFKSTLARTNQAVNKSFRKIARK